MNKKIFITGATGFIGSHLCELGVKKGYQVVGFDRYNSNNDQGWLKKSKYLKDIKLLFGDIRDYDSVFKSLKDCNTIFHLAALIGIPYSYFSPLAYLKTNVEGTYNILEAARNLGIKNTIITSTSEVYGSPQFLPINEEHINNAQSPYAASKIAADQLALSFFRSYKLPVKILRPFNTYGPRQSTRAIIPRIITQCLFDKKNNKKIILGNIKTSRDFNYVEDICEAYFVTLNHNELNGHIVNVGNNKSITIEGLAKKIMFMTKKNKLIQKNKTIVRPQLSEVNELRCDYAKFKKITGWEPRISLEEGLKKTISWFKKNKTFFSDRYEI